MSWIRFLDCRVDVLFGWDAWLPRDMGACFLAVRTVLRGWAPQGGLDDELEL